MKTNKAKHTEGPWTVADKTSIDCMATVICGPKYNIRNVLPQDANLISAAPEMLEALEGALYAIESHLVKIGKPHWGLTSARDGIVMAIAKAKGSES